MAPISLGLNVLTVMGVMDKKNPLYEYAQQVERRNGQHFQTTAYFVFLVWIELHFDSIIDMCFKGSTHVHDHIDSYDCLTRTISESPMASFPNTHISHLASNRLWDN